jgi:hypothetical protein
MIVTSLLMGSGLVGVIWALDALSLSESAKVLLLGGLLVGIAVWSRRYFKHRENP